MDINVTLETLSKSWDKQAEDYRPSAFWFWNGAMTDSRMRHVVETMAAQGIRECLVHPIHCLEVAYFSEDYFAKIQIALDLLREYGLKTWIYDEYGWPSGNVGGRLLDAHPEHNGWTLRFRKTEGDGIQAVPEACSNIMDNVIGAPWCQHQKGQLDTLSEPAVACFIDMAYAEYYRRFADYFGEVIVGFFTDEPAAMTPNVTDGTNLWNAPALPWTPELPRIFLDEFGYDLAEHYAELGRSGKSQVKKDYWAVVKRLHSQSYHRQIGDWCRSHGVKYTGHLGEDGLQQQVFYAGSAFQCLQQMDVPGVDQLGFTPDTDHRYLEQVTVASVTRHAGRHRSYCEAWGISSFDLRMSTMLHQAQMMGIHGINDIALMGFHQQLDGIRRYVYWPPMFDTAPNREWFGVFRDAFARTVALGSLGTHSPRYAILYPQDQLEQTGGMEDTFDPANPACQAVETLAEAIYAAGESFEFIFPEILPSAQGDGNRILLPHADYDAILAPGELHWYDETQSELFRLKKAGARIMDACTADLAAAVSATAPSWQKLAGIDHDGKGGALRIFQFDFEDGALLALRNVSEIPVSITLSSCKTLTEWNVHDGICLELASPASLSLPRNTGAWISVTDNSITEHKKPADSAKTDLGPQRSHGRLEDWMSGLPRRSLAKAGCLEEKCLWRKFARQNMQAFCFPKDRIPANIPCNLCLPHSSTHPFFHSSVILRDDCDLKLAFSVQSECPNLVPLQNIQFKYNDTWLDAVNDASMPPPYPYLKRFIPDELDGEHRIIFQAECVLSADCPELFAAFEKDHLAALTINGHAVDLRNPQPQVLWDVSCRLAAISDWVREGINTVAGVLEYAPFESRINSDLFYSFQTCRRSCDVFIAGDFSAGKDGTIQKNSGKEYPLPLRLEQCGLPHACTPAVLKTELLLVDDFAESAKAIELELVNEDAVEVLIDGVSLGKRICAPYTFPLPALAAGSHELTVRIAPTSGQLFYEGISWGIKAVKRHSSLSSYLRL